MHSKLAILSSDRKEESPRRAGKQENQGGEIYLDRFSDFCTQWGRFTMCNRGEVYGIYGGREISLRPRRIEMENFPNCWCELKGCLNRCVQH